MLHWNPRFRQATAILLLLVLTWFTGGGPAWAEQATAERDPAAALARLADDPRLPLTPEERETLERMLAAAGRGTAAPADRPSLVRHRERHAASELALVGRELAESLRPAPGRRQGAGPSRLLAQEVRDRVERAHAQSLEGFRITGERLRAAGAPAEKLARHAAARDAYDARMDVLLEDVRTAAAERSPDRAAAILERVAEALSTSGEDRPHAPFDPERMPHRAAPPSWQVPESEAAVAVARSSAMPPRRSVEEVEEPLATVATSLLLPTADDLAITPEVQVTPEIQALADSLGGSPLALFDWVRNHVEPYPTWGSVQGSRMTLEARRGNPFDQASLLIALLRASGIPARYVTGTIQVPVDQVRNWVGGAGSARMAQQILGIGGVANVGLTSGGVVQSIRLDHVWVEAWVDYVPGRGAVAGEGDSWVPLDPSFKQLELTPRSDVFAAVPLADYVDPTDLPFAVDPATGRITDLDTEIFDERLLDWVTASDEYLVANGLIAAGAEETFRNVAGSRRIVPATSTVFPASLPYRVVQRDGAVARLPDALRHSVELRGFRSDFDRALGSPTFSVQVSLPELNSRRLSVHFEPATQADADVLEEARSSGASSLPVYLVDVVPSVRLDDVEIGRGGSTGMGSRFYLDAVLRAPGRATTVPFQVTAGDEIVVGVTGNGVAPRVAEARFQANPVDEAPEYLHQVQLHYWAQADHLGALAAEGLGVRPLRLPSVGVFSSPLVVSYFFGTPRTGVYQGSSMDVQQSLVGGAALDPGAVAEWVKQSGYYGSYLEGSVFEQLASASLGQPRMVGISSLHLIAAAAAQGIPIYHVTPENRAVVLPLLGLSAAVEADVDRAVRQGQTALVPEQDVDLGVWRGVGYILQDPETGAGAYLISGGAAGGGLLDCLEELVPTLIQILQFLLFLILFLLLLALILIAIAGSAGTLAPAGAAAASFLFFLLVWRGAGGTSAPTMA